MKNIEKKISQFVENQFPEFYKEDGPLFIAFLKAYYEFLEQENQALYEARSLSDYKDIDTTLDEFIVYFKEKYLKNIQFDTATNKILLIKNALNLYRSKGTERSIDLFFKLIYGTDADVYYPADNILRISDGIWEKPFYLEISSSKYNIEYVGKQIIGSLSNATAFVERYIRRKTNRGYVNLLYISGIQGNFRNGEVIGMNINSVPTFDLDRRATLIGSVSSIIIIDKGKEFKVGDLVTFDSDSRGIGGIARVDSVSNATGVIDFIFEDGGWGYTLTADAIISEKVIQCSNVNPQSDSTETFKLFETIAQPLINVNFTSATANIIPGEIYTRYEDGNPSTTGKVVQVDQVGANGTATIAHISGAFTNTKYYSTSNTISFNVSNTENRTIIATVMGIPSVYYFTTRGMNGDINVSDLIDQKAPDGAPVGRGTVLDVSNGVITSANTKGSFKKSIETEDFYYTSGNGNISVTTSNNIVTGYNTLFNNNYINATLYVNSNVALGKVSSITNATSLLLESTSNITVSNVAHSYSYKFPLNDITSGASANITNISTSLGVYNIQKYYTTLQYSSANNVNIQNTRILYQYSSIGAETAKGLVMTSDYSAGSGNVTILPLSGRFEEGEKFYSEGNTAVATLTQYVVDSSGGDFIASPYARMHTITSNTFFFPTSLSSGSGADFKVGSIGDEETIFIGTDLLGANNKEYVNFGRRSLSIGSNSGFSVGKYAYQEVNKVAFNPSTALNPSTGFITLPSGANTNFVAGDNIIYSTSSGNSAIEANGSMFHVYFSNSTGVILSHVFDKEVPLSNTSYPDFGSNIVSETGHFLYKIASGKVFEVGSGLIRVKDIWNQFGNTGGGANTTQYGNTNVSVYGASTNTTITDVSEYSSLIVANQSYISVSLSADGYGFPKNTQGDIKDIIYSTLTFNAFTIGTIGSLVGVDPGSDYNIDPYVLAYQPYIANFNRKDFILEIENPTSNYIIGEKVNQQLANLTYYDLQVDSGVYANTYEQDIIEFDTQYDVNGTSETIYITGNSLSFNANSDVNGTDEFINLNDNFFVDGDYVKYHTSSGNTALSGLANNSRYFIVSSNTSGIKLSSTNGGSAINITASATSESGHYIVKYENPYEDGLRVLYQVPVGNTALSGLTSNTPYYIVDSNSSGFSLSSTNGGSAINITANSTGGEMQTFSTIAGFLPGERIYQVINETFNANTDVNNNVISLSPQPFAVGDLLTYYTSSGNTVLSGLANNTSYYTIFANTSGIKLSSTLNGSEITLTKGLTESGHNLVSSANATVKFVYTTGANSYIRVQDVKNTFTTGFDVYSYTNPYLDANVESIDLISTTSTAKGVIKPGSNSSVLLVKRLTFENTFVPGQAIVGDVSGASSTLISVKEDDSVNPIGLNANISANVITANGQINSLQVIDSGFGFTNSEIVQYTSEDGDRSGSIRVVVDGYGKGKGYYRSSKGFLSDTMYIHDGDYYQEYSYEVLSKMSIDKYANMFKQVMHMAGTKFFGSVRVIETANVNLTYANSSIVQS